MPSAVVPAFGRDDRGAPVTREVVPNGAHVEANPARPVVLPLQFKVVPHASLHIHVVETVLPVGERPRGTAPHALPAVQAQVRVQHGVSFDVRVGEHGHHADPRPELPGQEVVAGSDRAHPGVCI